MPHPSARLFAPLALLILLATACAAAPAVAPERLEKTRVAAAPTQAAPTAASAMLAPTATATHTPTIAPTETPQPAAPATKTPVPPTKPPEPTPTPEKLVPAPVAINTFIGPANFHPSREYAEDLLRKSFYTQTTGVITISHVSFPDKIAYDKFVDGESTGVQLQLRKTPTILVDITNAYVQAGASFVEFDQVNARGIPVHVILKLDGNPVVTNIEQGKKGWGAWFYKTVDRYAAGMALAGDRIGFGNPDKIMQKINEYTKSTTVTIDGTGKDMVVIFNGQ